MLKKVQIFKALDIEIKKQKGPSAIKESYRGHHSLKEELSQPGISIIAEVAGGNPLRGQVRENYRASTHAKSLVDNGAKALSIATDRFLFFGEDKHLSEVRAAVKVPIIRQDFIFEEYQIEESKILGADAIFLMAALLEPERLVALRRLAGAKGLDVVVQVASEADLKRAIDADADIICILGRDLDTWEPSWGGALSLMKKVPEKKCLRMIEAGVSTLQQIQELEALGVHGVIIGDPLLDEFYPGKRLAQILSGVEPLKKAPKAKGKPGLASGSSVAVKGKASTKVGTTQPTGGAVKAALPPPISHSHPARKGKKESTMAHSQNPEETNPPVEAAASPSPSPKKPAAKKAKKPAVKKAAAKKPAAKKVVKKAVKKAAPKKVAAKKVVKKAVKKAAAKKVVKKAVKKAAPKKAAAKKVVKKAVKKAAPKKVAAKKVVKKAVKKVAAKKVVKKAAPKKAAAKKVVKKAAAKKVVKKAVAKKPAAKKVAKKK